jgi:hypothetical protein
MALSLARTGPWAKGASRRDHSPRFDVVVSSFGRAPVVRPSTSICASRVDATNTVIIMENDGVLVDIHNHGHRRAFNEAFDEMGYSCSQWSPHIYYDLLRFGDSTGEGLIRAYYDMVRCSQCCSRCCSRCCSQCCSQCCSRCCSRCCSQCCSQCDVDSSNVPPAVTGWVEDLRVHADAAARLYYV